MSSISEQFLYARSLKTVKSLVLKDAKTSLCLVPSEYRRAYRQLLLQETLHGVLASHEQVSIEAHSGSLIVRHTIVFTVGLSFLEVRLVDDSHSGRCLAHGLLVSSSSC